MLFANQIPPLALVFTVLSFGILFAFALFLYRNYERLAQQSLERRFEGLRIHQKPRPGDVILSYHTYHGLLAWFTQTHLQLALPAQDARVLLGRLLRFNLTWGLLTPGAIFILPLSLFNYMAQHRAISRQKSSRRRKRR